MEKSKVTTEKYDIRKAMSAVAQARAELTRAKRVLEEAQDKLRDEIYRHGESHLLKVDERRVRYWLGIIE